MIGKTLHASSHRESDREQAMTQSLVRSVVFAACKGATALSCLAFFVAAALATPEQTQSKQDQPQAKAGGDAQAKASTKGVRATDLRGDYDWHRSNNDLLYYHLDIRVDPKEQSFGGKIGRAHV